MNQDPLSRLLLALGDATRRSLLERLAEKPGLTLGELTAGIRVTRQALSRHLAMLEAASLVTPVWRGREKLHYLDPAPLQQVPARWIGARQGDAALKALKQALAPAPQRQSADPLAGLLQTPPGKGLADARRFLADTAEAARRLIEHLPPTAAYTRPAKGGFSIAEHLWHLADIETLGWTPRFERLLTEKKPRLADVDGDRLARERDYQSRPWRGAARRFIAQRRRTLRALGHYDDALLARPAIFGGRTTTAGDVLAALLAHDAEHRSEIATLWEQHQR